MKPSSALFAFFIFACVVAMVLLFVSQLGAPNPQYTIPSDKDQFNNTLMNGSSISNKTVGMTTTISNADTSLMVPMIVLFGALVVIAVIVVLGRKR